MATIEIVHIIIRKYEYCIRTFAKFYMYKSIELHVYYMQSMQVP